LIGNVSHSRPAKRAIVAFAVAPLVGPLVFAANMVVASALSPTGGGWNAALGSIGSDWRAYLMWPAILSYGAALFAIPFYFLLRKRARSLLATVVCATAIGLCEEQLVVGIHWWEPSSWMATVPIVVSGVLGGLVFWVLALRGEHPLAQGPVARRRPGDGTGNSSTMSF